MIKIKQAYEQANKSDGFRILVDGAWPKGVSKQDGSIDLWVRQIAPTPPLRKWFATDVKKFREFSRRYSDELENRWGFLKKIKNTEQEKGTITLIYGAKDRKYNNAVVLKEYLDNMR
jgi:uncharacterized protein YeaO (DUF488 family)